MRLLEDGPSEYYQKTSRVNMYVVHEKIEVMCIGFQYGNEHYVNIR